MQRDFEQVVLFTFVWQEKQSGPGHGAHEGDHHGGLTHGAIRQVQRSDHRQPFEDVDAEEPLLATPPEAPGDARHPHCVKHRSGVLVGF